jgi:thiol:disulfide interchange protein
LEYQVLTPAYLNYLQTKYGLTLIEADLSQNNEAADNLLRSLNSISLPTIAIFGRAQKTKKPLVLRDWFAKKDLDIALDYQTANN